MYEIPDDFQPLQKADTEHLVRASKGPTKKEDCEVCMYVHVSFVIRSSISSHAIQYCNYHV